MLGDFIQNVIDTYRTDPRVGTYTPPGNPSGIPAIAKLPHPQFGFAFPPEALKIEGPEIVHVILPSAAHPMINGEGKFKRSHQVWVKAWDWSEEDAESLACDLYQDLSPKAIEMVAIPAREFDGTPNGYCIYCSEWLHLT